MKSFKKILKQIDGVFVLPRKRYYFGRIRHGTPYFDPWNFNRTILTIRKKRPKFLRCSYIRLFGYDISYGWPMAVVRYGLGWKDKYGTPRFEWSPSFQIWFFGWQFCSWWVASVDDEDLYWEMVLWYLYYSDKDIKKARKTWEWVDYITNKSTWNNDYLT